MSRRRRRFLLWPHGTRIVSAAMRVVPNSSTATSGTNAGLTYRLVEKTNVAVSNLWVEFWNGYVDAVDTTHAQEKAAGSALPIRMAILTGTSGIGADQSAATLWQLTWFNAAAGTPGYLFKLDASAASAADFTGAGGVISGDGLTFTIPSGYYARSDAAVGSSVSAGSKYMVHTEINMAGGLNFPSASVEYKSSLGEYRVITASGGTPAHVFNKNWSSGASALTGGGAGPVNVFGTGLVGQKVAATAGDSIFWGNQDSVAGVSTITGDANGCTGFANRAFNAGGYSWVRTAVSGAKAAPLYSFGGNNIRLLMLRYSSAVLSDMGHNDRSLPWLGAAPGGYRALYRWYWPALRAALLGGTGRVVSTDLLPLATSTDNFATTVNQTSSTGAGSVQFDSINPFFAAGGFNPGVGDPDAAYLANAAVFAGANAAGLTDIDALHVKWPCNGNAVPSAGCSDSTHPKGVIHAYVATDLQSVLPTLMGF